jgi:hypothetical protein
MYSLMADFNALLGDFLQRRSVTAVSNAIVQDTIPYCLYDLVHMHLIRVKKGNETNQIKNLLDANGFQANLDDISQAIANPEFVQNFTLDPNSGKHYLVSCSFNSRYRTCRLLMVNKTTSYRGGEVFVAKFALRKDALCYDSSRRVILSAQQVIQDYNECLEETRRIEDATEKDGEKGR